MDAELVSGGSLTNKGFEPQVCVCVRARMCAQGVPKLIHNYDSMNSSHQKIGWFTKGLSKKYVYHWQHDL